MFDNVTKELARFFFICIVSPDTNFNEDSIPPFSDFLAQAENFMTAADELFLRLRALEEVNETTVQTVFYDVGKEYYGIEKDLLRNWFRDLSFVWHKNPNFPRIGTFVTIFGIDNYISSMNEKINDPFGFKGKYAYTMDQKRILKKCGFSEEQIEDMPVKDAMIHMDNASMEWRKSELLRLGVSEEEISNYTQLQMFVLTGVYSVYGLNKLLREGKITESEFAKGKAYLENNADK